MNRCMIQLILLAASGAALGGAPAWCADRQEDRRLQAPLGSDGGGAEGAWLGVWLGDAVDGGAQVVALVPRGPAFVSGIRIGDIIVGNTNRDTKISRFVFEEHLVGLRDPEATR